MRIPWTIQRCIICLCEPQEDDPLSSLTDAHVIPESVGGELSARFLCKGCNSEMGRVEAQLPRDVQVIELVRRLRNDLPEELARGALQHAGWFAGTDEYGQLEGRERRAGGFSLRESEKIRTDKNVLAQIRAELQRRDVPAEEIDRKLGEFGHAADGTSLEVMPGFTIRKHIDLSEVSFERTYDERLAPRAIALGIAYTFLALTLEERIYGEALEPVRDALRGVIVRDMTEADAWPIECLRTSSPAETKHALAVIQEPGGVLVRIWLFRELVWDVRFAGVETITSPFYLLDLVTKEESIA